MSCRMSGNIAVGSILILLTGVLSEESFGVSYTSEHVCALNGSSVELSCSYKYPAVLTVRRSLWFINWQASMEPVDVSVEVGYHGRVKYSQNSQNNCSITITNLRESDAHTYKFRFHTDDPLGKYTGEPGVTLSVTDLKVTVSGTHGGKNLKCSSTCTLSNNPTYVWYKNGQRESRCTSVSCPVPADSGADRYRCAVEGHENLPSPAVYSPRVPSVTDRASGDSVTLLCYSDSNPISSYTWYKKTGSDVILIGNGTNLTLNTGADGLLYCVAKNCFGSSSSPEWSFTSDNTAVKYTASGVTVGVFLGLVAALLWMRSRAAALRNRCEQNSGNHDSTAVYGNISALAMTSDPTQTESLVDQDDVQYASITFIHNPTQAVFPSSTARHLDPSEEEDVQYTYVNFSRHTAAIQSLAAEAADDTSQIYSQSHKPKSHT